MSRERRKSTPTMCAKFPVKLLVLLFRVQARFYVCLRRSMLSVGKYKWYHPYMLTYIVYIDFQIFLVADIARSVISWCFFL